MIDIRSEEIFPLSQAAKCRELPPRRGGKRPHAATVFRWAKRGVRGVRLETIRVGGTLCTSVEALQRFFDALSQTDNVQPTRRTATGLTEWVERELDAAGI